MLDLAFHIGDRVMCLVDNPDGNADLMAGFLGSVCYLTGENKTFFGVHWDSAIAGGHDCHGCCEDGHGWLMDASEIKLIEPDDESDAPFEFNENLFHELFV